ncbi:MAG: hypothetical protein ACRCX8_14465 [Sarcina sp.]
MTHGAKNGRISLKKDLEEIYYEECKTTKVEIAQKGEEIEL